MGDASRSSMQMWSVNYLIISNGLETVEKISNKLTNLTGYTFPVPCSTFFKQQFHVIAMFLQ